MSLPKEREYTAEDYWGLPERRRAELIDGQLYDMAPPDRAHQEIVVGLSAAILDHIRSHNGDCKIYPAPFAVNLTSNDKTWVEPDISVICDKSKLSDRGCEGPPDWVVEVVSPGSIRTDYSVKLFKYRTAGVREYWIVNPMKGTILTYSFEGEEDADESLFGERISSRVLRGFSVKMADLLL